ncbi:uncharacterized protein LOC128254932 isoform X2 [Drosophila gunungcola]|uniref:Ima1 N-terminal domain-containing protein n=1 Tax=Drosophila gunungcola TaxID=103775 RepID=A0A9P9YKX0_9MUSC|nr:uncharacterized protein LOC128254932 isoform X2 [Drosophila gunungcola]KAI8038429.1 hypothetical protein M5D96_008327 [Drosophila gunungcola]
MITLLIPLAATVLPILAILFVAGTFLYKLYVNIRSRYDARVNCWFCNGNARVPYANRNSWTCPKCEQYNGFTKDGDYNRDMTSQRDCSIGSQKNSSQGSSSICANSYYADVLAANPPAPKNGLCDPCNEAQRLKVEKLSQFEPKNESRFDQELKVYRERLEKQFRLCSSCERHLNKVLHEKKKMVLSSKFLNYIIKGASLLKQPHFNRLASAQKQQKLHRYRVLMTILTVVNILCLLCSLPHGTLNQFRTFLGDFLGKALFYVYSHVLALIRVTTAGVGTFLERRESTAKLLLYGRTFGKLLLYSVGLSQQQVQQATFASCFVVVYPYAMLAVSFLHKINDGLKFTRFTIVLLLWSAYATGIELLAPHMNGISFILLGSVLTLALLATNKSNLLSQVSQNESACESFHRLCADECDEETLSMLSQQLSGCSNNSNGNLSLPSASVCHSPAPTISQRTIQPPASLLSLDSLRLSKQQQAWSSNYGGASTVVTPPPQPAMMFQQKPMRQLESQWYRPAPNSLAQNQAFTRSTNNLLMPSRLPAMSRNVGGADVGAWVAANQSINQDLSTASLMRHYEEKQQHQLSRTSSQSSGFESQTRQETQWGTAAQPSRDYGWSETQGSQRNLAVFPPLASPTPTLMASEYQYPRATMPQQQATVQPGDLLKRWMEISSKASQPIH